MWRTAGDARASMVLPVGAPTEARASSTCSLHQSDAALGKGRQAVQLVGCFTGQGNGQGAASTDRIRTSCPLSRLRDPVQPAPRRRAVGSPRATAARPSACERARPGREGGVRALLVMAPTHDLGARPSAVEPRINRLDLLVVVTSFLAERRSMPTSFCGSQWAEHEGTLTNLEGRCCSRPARPPPRACAPF